jgi:aminopeptidase S
MHRTFKSISFAVLLLSALAAVAGRAAGKDDASARFAKHVTAITNGASTKDRRAAIEKALDEIGVKYTEQKFEYAGQSGVNILVQLPPVKGAKQLMLGAHYDRVEEGKGAVDNASGTAAVLELLRAFKAKPLKNYSVSAAFFDLEEIGLRGSANYVTTHVSELPALFINFDVFGYGDTLWAMTRSEDSIFASSITAATTKSKFPVQLGPAYPPSDHLSFLKADVESTSISLIGGDEIPGILKVFGGERPEKMPKVLTIIHSPNDTFDKIDATAAARGLAVIEDAIRLIDMK